MKETTVFMPPKSPLKKAQHPLNPPEFSARRRETYISSSWYFCFQKSPYQFYNHRK